MADVPGYQPIDVRGYQPEYVPPIILPLPVLVVPEYDLAYITDTTWFSVDDIPALQWAITLVGGGNVTPPTAATLTIERPDGLIDSDTTLFISSGVAATPITLSGFYKFLLQGIYTLVIAVTFNDGITPEQVRSCITECQIT